MGEDNRHVCAFKHNNQKFLLERTDGSLSYTNGLPSHVLGVKVFYIPHKIKIAGERPEFLNHKYSNIAAFVR